MVDSLFFSSLLSLHFEDIFRHVRYVISSVIIMINPAITSFNDGLVLRRHCSGCISMFNNCIEKYIDDVIKTARVIVKHTPI